MKGLPLNVMYWVDRGEQYEDDPDEPRYEVLDGQQRTISLCEYVDGSFSVDDKYFYNLPGDQQKQILDYELFVYVCEGTDSEKLEWFRIINIAGALSQEWSCETPCTPVPGCPTLSGTSRRRAAPHRRWQTTT